MAKSRERKIPEILIFSDTNILSGDVGALVVLAYLADKKLINIKGIITERGTYEVRRRRAMYAKGVMSYLGYPFIRVVPGGDYDVENETAENIYLQNDLTPIFENAGLTVLRSGTIFLQEYMKATKGKSVFLFINGPFSDFGKYVKATRDVVSKKVKKVILVGDVLPQKNDQGFYEPDLTSLHFKSCPEAAKLLFDYLQQKDMRTTIVPENVTDGMVFDFSFLDAVQKSKNPVVKQLLSAKSDEASAKTTYYKMLAALAVSDGMFKGCGGLVEKKQEDEKNISFAKLLDPLMMREKLIEFFREKLEPKKISLASLKQNNQGTKE